MTRTGRPPKPLALKLLNGSAAHHPERTNRNPAQPADRPPTMPPGMSPRAQAVWAAVLRHQAPGVILAAHAPLLRVYVEAVARYEEASALLASSGPLVRRQSGELGRNPLAMIVRSDADLIRATAGELGLSPSSVSRFASVRPAVEDDPLLRLLTPIPMRKRKA